MHTFHVCIYATKSRLKRDCFGHEKRASTRDCVCELGLVTSNTFSDWLLRLEITLGNAIVVFHSTFISNRSYLSKLKYRIKFDLVRFFSLQNAFK